MSLGYNIKVSDDKTIIEDYNFDRHFYSEYYNSYSIEEIPENIRPYISNNNEVIQDISNSEVINYEETPKPLDSPMDSPWSMYCHDVRHTGRSPYSTSGNVGFNKWWFKCIGSLEGSAAIDKDGIIYFGGAEDDPEPNIYFYAFYPNGTVKWKCKIDWFIRAGPAIDEDGTIYAGNSRSGSGIIYAINPNGTRKWALDIGGPLYSSPAIAEDGTIYMGDGGNWGIKAINPNGTLKWCYKTNFLVYSSPAIGDDGTVYCGSHDTNLYALYPNNGTLKWKYKTGHWIRTSPCIGDDGTIYCVSLDGYLHALYPNGTRKWRTKVGGGTSPTIGQDGTIYCGWDNLYAINPDGTVKWSINLGSECIEGATPCTSADGTIYFGTRIRETSGGNIIAVDSNGVERWRERISNDWCDFAPVIGEDGTVYIGSSTMEETRPGAFIFIGYLYAFNKKDDNAPLDPLIIGPSRANSRKEINYTFKSTSPLGNDVYYYIDWGDGDWKIDWWLGPYGSGENAIISHTWSEPGMYNIRTRCKDSDNLWSDWSEFKVTIPRNRATSNVLFFRFLEHFPLLREVLLRLITK